MVKLSLARRIVLQVIVSVVVTLVAMMICIRSGLGDGFAVAGSYFVLALVLTFFYESNRRRFPNAGLLPVFGTKGHRQRTAIMLVVLVAALLVSITVTSLPAGLRLRSDWQWRLGVPLMLTLAVGLFEEVLFRGYLFGLMRFRFPIITCLLANGLLFALFHIGAGTTWPEPARLSFLGFAYYVVTAMVLCLAATETKSLMSGIAFHVVANYIVGFPHLKLDELLTHNGIFVISTPNADQRFVIWMTSIFVLLILILIYRNRVAPPKQID